MSAIEIRGARVHNLRSIDIDIPRDKITVITGVSGSGKSSLAFDTLYAEGQRQYIDSLSAYARQFLDQIPRPDVDSIDGLAPTLAIDQKNHASGSRSTVATISEIYDYLRLMFARAGTPHCTHCGSAVSTQTAEVICETLLRLAPKTKLVVMAPLVRGRKGVHREIIESIQKAGLVRARVDGKIYLLEEIPPLGARKNHTIEAIVDRLVLREGIETRLRDSVDLALKLADGLLSTIEQSGNEDDWNESIYSTAMACADCGMSFAEIQPRTFSFNSPYGACPTCQGLGSVGEGEDVEKCGDCNGSRLNREARHVTIAGITINKLTSMPLGDSAEWMRSCHESLSALQQKVAEPISREVIRRLEYLIRVGVSYLTLDRTAETLSGGELQRVRLATSIGSGLVGVCYVLDEPSIGLHPADHDRLIGCLRDLQSQGNTVVIVEHDEATMMAADKLIDIGPNAGIGGGQLIAQGTPKQVARSKRSLTGEYLSGKRQIPIPVTRRTAKHWLKLSGVTTNNLQDVTAKFPLGTLIGISGASGSGKSSLINDTLSPALAKKLGLKTSRAGSHKSLTGAARIDKLVPIDQTPIGRSPRSCPATYTGILDQVRKVFAATREAKTRGFLASRFSFNAKAGQCELCKGHGVERIPMNFLSDLFVTCSRCGGNRFNRQTLQVRFKGMNVSDVLRMSVDEAAEFFENVPKILRPLRSLQSVGLGYLHLGQSSTTLSGGEAQRIKLGTELARVATGNTLYLLDEPTTGLHFADVERLVGVLQKLVDAGNTVIVIEHNTHLLATCDYLMDLGPSGGTGGGHITATGTPEEVANTKTATGLYLKTRLA